MAGKKSNKKRLNVLETLPLQEIGNGEHNEGSKNLPVSDKNKRLHAGFQGQFCGNVHARIPELNQNHEQKWKKITQHFCFNSPSSNLASSLGIFFIWEKTIKLAGLREVEEDKEKGDEWE